VVLWRLKGLLKCLCLDICKKFDTFGRAGRGKLLLSYEGDLAFMVKTSKRIKSAPVAVLLGILLSTTTSITLAEAVTIKNGVSCKKSGLKAKSGTKRYVCGKNPYVKPTKLTWMLTSCPEAYDLYMEAKDQYGIFKDILSVSPEGLSELSNLQKSMDSLDALMKTKVCKRGA
jgi:hypothetical protein